MTRSPLETLQNARELISDQKRWTQKAFARDASGNVVDSDDKAAVCFCAAGAITKAANNLHVAVRARHAFREVARQSVLDFNDSHTHAEVLAVFDLAIEKARALQ
ncbi:UNVERIFIED_ORG: hypothetical protein J2W19_003182 [Shinella zoogloeoides]|nr:hypothetical protein [Shinella zoogloeoides]